MTSETSPKSLTRSRSDRWMGGVAGGVAAYFGLDAALVRVGFVVSMLFTGGASIVAYLAMLVIMPDGDELPATTPLPV